MEERLGEMRKGRRERMRKGATVSSSPQVGAQASKFGFFKLIECIMSWCETECKNICAIGELFILGGQIIDQKRKKGWWRGRRERIEKREQREDRDREKRDKRELS